VRTVEFVPGTHRSTQHVVAAVLRAIERRGTRVWRGGNVSREIAAYVSEHFDEAYEASHVSYALKWLEDKSYGERRRNGNRTVGFELHADVNTRVPSYLLSGWGDYGVETRRHPKKPTTVGAQPSLPFRDDVPLYGLDELMKALERWATEDHDAYTAWVDQVLAQLKESPT